MRRLLVTGFGAFPGQADNASARLARLLERRRRAFALAGVELHVCVLPVERFALSPELCRLYARIAPHAVLHLGVAARRRQLSVESLARNRASILRPDAAKSVSWSRFIVHGGPDALRSPAPAARLAALARRHGEKAEVSRDAGDYLCNEILFLSLLMDRRASFLHLPAWRGARLRKALPAVEAMAKALALA